MRPDILISAILVVGAQRKRAQRSLDALYAQTMADAIEVIVVDLSADDHPILTQSEKVRTLYVSRPAAESYSKARVEGVKLASSDIVAFIEDHCFAAPEWAVHLVEAHRGPWAAVGYAFTNANPETYIGRASMIADYGPWMHPVTSGPVRWLPANNISYKKDALLRFIENLETAFSPDFILHETYFGDELLLFQDSGAIAAHQNFDYLSGMLQSSHEMCRIMASNRVLTQSWSRRKSIIYGLCAPPVVPVLRLLRLIAIFRKHPFHCGEFIAALPVIFLAFTWSAIGESIGYMFGPSAEGEQEFKKWELEAERVARSVS